MHLIFFFFVFSFFRKGKAEGFREEMSPEYIKKFDEWQQKNA